MGAGLAGAAAATVLGRQGWRVTLVDPRPSCPPVFKAEKIEPDQARSLRKLQLADSILPHTAPIRSIHAYYNGRLYGTSQTEQYGAYYSDMVNALRSRLPASVRFRQERVVRILNTTEIQRVSLSDGEELSCRLVVLASGLSADLPVALRLKRSNVQKYQSVALAFTIARADSRPFPFDSASYYSINATQGIDYITLFPICGAVRVNIFAFPRANDPWVGEFVRNPILGLKKCFPKLHRAIGEYRITSKVESSVVHLYRTEKQTMHGIALIGDAAQNVCPSTGMGLSKILSDVDVLSEYVPAWLDAPGAINSEKIATFCNDPRKCAVDLKALRNAFYRRQAATGTSMKWRLHRARLHLTMQFRRATELAPSRS